MSDAPNTDDAEEKDPNFSAERITTNHGGKIKPGLRFTFGPERRVIETEELSLGDQLNLVELVGDSAGNQRYMTMAGFAASVRKIDSTYYMWPTHKRQLMDRLDGITEEGFLAYIKAVRATSTRDEAADPTQDIAKNS